MRLLPSVHGTLGLLAYLQFVTASLKDLMSEKLKYQDSDRILYIICYSNGLMKTECATVFKTASEGRNADR